MESELIPLLLVLPILLIASGICSGSETALFRLSRRDRERMGGTHPGSARAVAVLLKDPGAVLVTVLLLNMVVNVLYFVIVSVLAMEAANPFVQVGLSIGSLLALILVGEVLAKLIAGSQRVRFMGLTAPILLATHRVLVPLRLLVMAIVHGSIRLVRPGREPESSASHQQLRALIGLGASQGTLAPDEERILGQVVLLSSRRVREIMTPRPDILFLDLDEGLEDARELARQTGHSNFPAAHGSLDQDTPSIIDLRQALARAELTGSWQPDRHTRTALFIPENIRLDRALSQLRERGDHLALCVDEHGAISGLLEIEGLVETLALPWTRGNTRASDNIQSVAIGTWVVPARLGVREFDDFFPAHRPTAVPTGADQSDATTLGGVVQDLLGHVPRVGDEVRWRGYVLRVESAGAVSAQTILVIDPEVSP